MKKTISIVLISTILLICFPAIISASILKTGGFSIGYASIPTKSSTVTTPVYLSKRGNVTIKIYYKKGSKWKYHSKTNVFCNQKTSRIITQNGKNKKATVYKGNFIVNTGKMTPGTEYKATINNITHGKYKGLVSTMKFTIPS